MTQLNLISIVTMWSKINELSRQSLSQMQIAIKLGISRDTDSIVTSSNKGFDIKSLMPIA